MRKKTLESPQPYTANPDTFAPISSEEIAILRAYVAADIEDILFGPE